MGGPLSLIKKVTMEGLKAVSEIMEKWPIEVICSEIHGPKRRREQCHCQQDRCIRYDRTVPTLLTFFRNTALLMERVGGIGDCPASQDAMRNFGLIAAAVAKTANLACPQTKRAPTEVAMVYSSPRFGFGVGHCVRSSDPFPSSFWLARLSGKIDSESDFSCGFLESKGQGLDQDNFYIKVSAE
jgi:hypothetical protein